MSNLIKLSEAEQKKLEELRKQSKITQEKLAEDSTLKGFPFSLDDYKRVIGTKKDKPHGVDRYIIENIAKALGVKPTDFIEPDKWQPDEIKQLTRHFDPLIDEKIRRFYGRKFVFNAWEKFINKRDRGYFTLVGDPGSGKSAAAAYYISQIAQKDCVYYFNIYTTGQNRADQFLENICQQLIKRYQLDYPKLPGNYTRDGVFFADLLTQISEKLQKSPQKERLIIVIDALDEVNLSSQSESEGSNVLYLPRYLPEKVYFFLTRRRELETRLLFEAPEEIIDLKDYATESEEDIKGYIKVCFEDEEFKEGLNQFLANNGDLSKNQIIDELARISENNFMYLRYVIPQMAKGYYQSLNISELPKGLKDYYTDHWRRMGMNQTPLPTVKLNLIYLICQAKTMPSRQLLAKYANVSELIVQEVLNKWSEFLRSQVIDGQTCYQFYHKSFVDFLRDQDTVKSAGIELDKIHKQISDTLWQVVYGED